MTYRRRITRNFLTISSGPFHSFRHWNKNTSMALACAELADSMEHSWTWKVKSSSKRRDEGHVLSITGYWDNSLIHMVPPVLVIAHLIWTKDRARKTVSVPGPFSVRSKAVQSTHGRSRSHGSLCCNVSSTTQKQTVVHHSVLSQSFTAWHLYQMSGLEKKDLLHFEASVARALINASSVQINKRGRPSGTPLPLKRWTIS